jgi:hypothetical protein
MGTWPLVLLIVLITPLIFRNSDPAQKLRVRTALKVTIAAWVVLTLFLIAKVGLSTHWANIPALLLVFSIPFAITVGAYKLMTKTLMK